MAGKKRYKLKEGFKRYWQAGIWAPVFEVLLNPSLPASTTEGKEAVEAGLLLRELETVRGALEGFLLQEGERKGLRAAVRRMEALLAATTADGGARRR